jgi:GT2 family glycosyltransferase
LLRHTLDSLYVSAKTAREAAVLGRVTVDVVDNASERDYQCELEHILGQCPHSEFLSVRYIAMPDNRGFGAGHNRVLKDLDSDYHLILNPDVELDGGALLVGLSRMEEDGTIALLSPGVTADTGVQEFLCKHYPSVLVLFLRAFAPAFVRRFFRERLGRYQMEEECSSGQEVDITLASGCFMLVPTAALRAMGGFDEAYFLYFEDFDLSLRLGEQGRLVFNPLMRIVHHGGYAAEKGMLHVRYFIRSGFRFFRSHGWRWI